MSLKIRTAYDEFGDGGTDTVCDGCKRGVAPKTRYAQVCSGPGGGGTFSSRGSHVCLCAKCIASLHVRLGTDKATPQQAPNQHKPK